MTTNKQLHEHVRGEVVGLLDGRSWRWLSRRTGIPWSTLQGQVSKPRFTLRSLVLIADALDVNIDALLPGGVRRSTLPEL